MHRPPSYGMADNVRPPPYHYAGDYYPQEKRRGGNVCLRCICVCYCILFFLILIVAVIALFIFTHYDPKYPIYKFEALDVKELGYRSDSINADLILTVKADNVNKKLGFVYDEPSSISVTYSGSTICSGKFPSFQHGPKNITMLQIELSGKNQFASGLYNSLQDDERHGKIPLALVAKVPFRVFLGDSKLKKYTAVVNVTISVHDLKLGKKSEIEQGKIEFKFEN